MLMTKQSITSFRGFTVVELLIVIVVIAIIAAIVIVSYTGIQARAVETSMRSDLDSAASVLALDRKNTASYPATASAANGGKGLATSSDNVITYETRSDQYCISITNPKTNTQFRYRSSDQKTTEGNCEATVSTLVGTGTGGYLDGVGTAAQIRTPQRMTFSADGTLYLADFGNHRIRTVSPNGTVATLAGLGTSGYVNGTNMAARFYGPAGVAFGPDDTLYVVDMYNYRIRAIAPGGGVSLLAGSGSATFANGTGASASFNAPSGIAVDSSGIIYVTDRGNNRIRAITPAGVASTYAGTGTAGSANGARLSAQFNSPSDIAIGPDGTFYITDWGTHSVRTISPAGVVGKLAGTGIAGTTNGAGTAAQFQLPEGIAVDSKGTVYVADTANNLVRMITPAGVVSTLAGTGVSGSADGKGSAAQFRAPHGIAVGPDGAIYVSEASGHRIRKIQW